MISRTRLRGRGLRSSALAALTVMILALVVATPAVTTGQAQTQTAGGTSAPSGETSDGAQVVKVSSHRPARRKVVRKRFTPWSRPSPRRVRQIIRIEARRWKISAASLTRRVRCESTFRWNASSGSYHGLLQFAPSTFARGLRSIRTRRVVVKRRRTRRVRAARVVRYSDGRVEREPGASYRQRVTRLYVGKLPRRPGLLHAWAQIRIGAQAIRGISAVSSSEWGCSA